jgi:Bacteriocin-protection, YdeI or OmpD-Associated/Domain of unknown function (DUF1905)
MSGDYLTFEGRIEAVEWGKATYTILPLPSDIGQTLTAAKARRVEGEINDHPFNLALTRAPVVDGPFLWAGKTLLDRVGIAPGETIDVRLRPAPDDLVEVPEDLASALGRAGLIDLWEGLTPGKQRGHLYQISTAKTAPTRAKRIDRLLADLSDGLTAPPARTRVR